MAEPIIVAPSEGEPPGTVEITASGKIMTASRVMGFGIASIVLGLAAIVLFGLGSDSGLETTFVLNPRDPTIEIPDLTVPSRATCILLGLVCAGIGALMLARPRAVAHRTYLLFGVVVFLFVFALMTWAARGDSTNLLGLLNGTLRRSIPIALGALAGVLCERAGVINIAIEGMLLTGAFAGSMVASAIGSEWLGLPGGVLAGVAVGVGLGAVLASLSIRYRVDQIIGGTVINLFALGITSFLAAALLVEYQDTLNRPPTFTNWAIPLLSDIPFIGPLLFDNTFYVYLTFVLVFVLSFALYRTRWGLRVRSVGEHPRAADTVGIDVWRTRFRSVLLGGAVAGLAGTFFTLDSAGRFEENMTAGRGFIALAALIFGRWSPIGAFCAALVFGFSEELAQRLSILDTPIPSEFLLMTPYVVTIFVVAGLVGRARPPAADGQPYVKG